MTKKNKKIAGVLIFIAILIIINYKSIPKLLKNLETSDALSKYSTEINKCVKEKEIVNKDKKQNELQYSCALEVAANAYKTDKENAIDICLKYSAISNWSIDDNDAQAKKLKRMSCQTIIENRLKK